MQSIRTDLSFRIIINVTSCSYNQRFYKLHIESHSNSFLFQMSHYAVVTFLETNEISRVPMRWLYEVEGNVGQCLWPKKGKTVERFINTDAPPGNDWSSHLVKLNAKNGECRVDQ